MSTILTISGSNRKGSINTSILNALPELAPKGVTLEHLDWSTVPLYNQDLESSFPEVVNSIKEKIRSVDGIIISTPEYNRSIPAPLKNLIDWTSRPYGGNAWAGKKVYVIGATLAPTVGTAAAQMELRKVLLYLDARLLGQPEFYLHSTSTILDEQGMVTDQDTKDRLRKNLEVFSTFVE